MDEPRVDTTERTLTVEKFRALPEENEHRVELVRGSLVREPLPGAEHGWLLKLLFRAIDDHAEVRGLGVAFTDTGFLLSNDPPTISGPDVAFVAAEKLPPEGPPEGYWRLAPNLAVEIVSPSNAAAGIQAKVLEYLEAETRLVWVVDPGTRTVTTYRTREEVRLLTVGDALEGADVLPGFRLEISTLFEFPGP